MITDRLPSWFAPKFEPGSVVQLRSGGHSMTIESIEGGKASCVWSDKRVIRRGEFAFEALKRSTEGVDLTLIVPGLNASQEECAEVLANA